MCETWDSERSMGVLHMSLCVLSNQSEDTGLVCLHTLWSKDAQVGVCPGWWGSLRTAWDLFWQWSEYKVAIKGRDEQDLSALSSWYLKNNNTAKINYPLESFPLPFSGVVKPHSKFSSQDPLCESSVGLHKGAKSTSYFQPSKEIKLYSWPKGPRQVSGEVLLLSLTMMLSINCLYGAGL